MARETFTIDGWLLNDGIARDWEYRSGTEAAPPPTGSNGVVPNRTGEFWRPKVYGPGTFSLAIWLSGDTRESAMAAWNTLLRAVARPQRLLRVARTLPSGEVIYCDAEVVSKIAPVHIGQLGYRAEIEFSVPGTVWLSNTVYTQSTEAGAPLPQTLDLTEFEPSTAAMELLSYRIVGRVSDPRLVDITDGVDADSCLFTGTVGAGQSLTLDAATWAVTAVGFTPNLAAVNPTGRRLMTVSAARPGATPRVQLRGTNLDSSTQLVVTGRRAYLC